MSRKLQVLCPSLHSVLLEEYIDKIDKKFEHLFERLNQNPKSVTVKLPAHSLLKELDALYRQISKCQEQWPARKKLF